MTQSSRAKVVSDTGITEATTPIAKLKSPMPLDFVKGAWNEFSQAHFMTGSDESIFYAIDFFGEKPYTNSNQWDWIFEDGAMHKHGNMGQGIYVDPTRDFVGINFAVCPNEGERGPDRSPGYLRAAAKMFAGQ